MFAKHPENPAIVRARHVVGDTVVLHEAVFRSEAAPPLEVISIDSFAGERVDGVEFVR